MKIRELLKQSFSNPLGHMLASANLLMAAASAMDMSGINEKFVLDLNRPAFLADQLLGSEFGQGIFALQLVYLQWIFIAGFAKCAAAVIRPPHIG